jgi:hypothetical protein
VAAIVLLVSPCRAQDATQEPRAKKGDPQINVNWLYGSFVPKDVPLVALTNEERLRLYVRQTFTTPGIYVKTALFSVGDQINNSPPAWGDGLAGYGRRFASRQAQFVIQNSFSALGNAMLGYEPRYDRCRCSGFGRRTRHALVRNFVTYNRTEKELRPQLALCAAAFGAGAVGSTWKPNHPNALHEGYRGTITQIGFGFAANWLSEFAPDIMAEIGRKKTDPAAARH